MSDATRFWKPWEKSIRSYSGIHKIIDGIFTEWAGEGRLFAWRGVADSSRPLHSSLYRRLLWTKISEDPNACPPTEAELCREEKRIFLNIKQWRLHNTDRGRLSALEQLAMLQHFGAPTRLIDIAFNPYIGLWFAVADGHEKKDGRLFAVDVTKRLLNSQPKLRDWENENECPWIGSGRPKDWSVATYAWRPPPFERRIAAQNGGFLLGGVPTSGTNKNPKQWPKQPQGRSSWWKIEEVRGFTSVALRTHKIQKQRTNVQPVYTIRIHAAAKTEIRARLEQLFGYTHATIYPDYSGFSDFGTPGLVRYPSR